MSTPAAAIAEELRRLACSWLRKDPGDSLSDGWTSRYARELYARAQELAPAAECQHVNVLIESLGPDTKWTSCLTCGQQFPGEWKAADHA